MARILIVEDERNIRKFMSVNLVARGYQVIEAQDAREALRRLREAPVDMLLLDIKLPDMSGWEILEIMGADRTYRQIPVIIVTASSSGPNPDRPPYDNLRRILLKPIAAGELVHEIQAVLKH